MTEQTAPPTSRVDRRRFGLGAVAVVLLALLAGLAWWSAPRAQVPVPGAGASPETVVRAYIDAVNARDFDTANAIRPGDRLGRFSRPMQISDLTDVTTRDDVNGRVAVDFMADIHATDGSMEEGRQWWGYLLERSDDGHWLIVDAGVA